MAVYSFTPAWIGGVLQIVPLLGILGFLLSLYGLYLLYLGLPRLMKCAEDKAIAYTAVVAVCGVVVMLISGLVVGSVTTAGLIGAGALGSVAGGGDAADVRFDPDSPLGVLQGIGEALEERAGARARAAAAAWPEPANPRRAPGPGLTHMQWMHAPSPAAGDVRQRTLVAWKREGFTKRRPASRRSLVETRCAAPA